MANDPRLSQVAAELAVQNRTPRLSQFALELALTQRADLRLSQLAAEIALEFFAAPFNFTAVPTGTTVDLAWALVSTNADAIEVHRLQDTVLLDFTPSAATLLVSLPGNALFHPDVGAPPVSRLLYKLRAVKGAQVRDSLVEIVATDVDVAPDLSDATVWARYWNNLQHLWSVWPTFADRSCAGPIAVAPQQYCVSCADAQGTKAYDVTIPRAILGWSNYSTPPDGNVYVIDPLAALLKIDEGAADEAEVSGMVALGGQEVGPEWAKHWDAELQGGGICALASGGDLDGTPHTGVAAYVWARTTVPYGDCATTRFVSGGQLLVELRDGSGLTGWAVDLTTVLKSASYYFEEGTGLCESCRRPFAWYGLRLRVTKPSPGQLRIQAAVLRGSVPPVGSAWNIDQTVASDLGSGCAGYVQKCYTLVSAFSPGGGSHRTFHGLAVDNITPTGGQCAEQQLIPPPPPEIPAPTPGVQPSPCPDPLPDGSPVRLFFGTGPVTVEDGTAVPGGRLLEYWPDFLDDGQRIIARCTPNDLAPAGPGGSAIFHALFLALTYSGDAIVNVTPILNGERLPAESRQIALFGTGTPRTERFEIPLSRLRSDRREGLRGTWLTFEIDLVDVCSKGLTLEAVEVDHTPLRELLPGMTYTARQRRRGAPGDAPVALFFGAGGSLYRFDADETDDGAAVPAQLRPNEVAPAGVAGECEFAELFLTFTHQNNVPVTLKLTPIVDGIEYEEQEIVLPIS